MDFTVTLLHFLKIVQRSAFYLLTWYMGKPVSLHIGLLRKAQLLEPCLRAEQWLPTPERALVTSQADHTCLT